METKRSGTTGRNITVLALSATLATAGLGLTGLSANPAWADEGTPAPAAAPADPAAPADGEAAPAEPEGSATAEAAPEAAATTEAPKPAAQVFPTVTPVTDTQKVTIELTNEATLATQLFDAVNAARESAGLTPLAHDAALDQVAWQRAAESVVLAADVRPDGTAVSTVDPAAKLTGETLVAGAADKAGTAELALAFAQADATAQANLTSAAHVGMGVALVRDAAGAFHWAVVYSDTPAADVATGAEQAPVADGTKTYTLTVPSANLTPAGTAAIEAQVDAGATKQLALGARLKGVPFSEQAVLEFDETQPLALASATWTSVDAAIASVNETGLLTGVANGITQVSAQSATGAITGTWNVTVGDGQPATPEPTPEEGSGEGDKPADQPADQPAEGEGGDTPDEGATGDEGATEPTTPPAEGGDQGDKPATGDEGQTPDEGGQPATPTTPTTPETPAESATGDKPAEQQKIDLASDKVKVLGITAVNATLDGQPVQPNVSLATADDHPIDLNEYTVAFSNNTAPGEGTITITANPESTTYTGTRTETFPIDEPVRTNLADVAVVAPIDDQTLADKAVEPKPTVTLNDEAGTPLAEGTDYTVSYKNNEAVGTGTVVITGTGAYTGELTATFNIVTEPAPAEPKDIAQATVEPIAEQTYTGEAIEPKPVVKMGDATLAEGTDYTLSYANNVEAGEATITITGTGAYEGTLTARFVIVKPELINLRTAGFAIADIPDQTLGETAPEPALSVSDGTTTLTAGTDYTVRYENNSVPGTARAVVTGTGAYTGVIDKAFKVVSGAEERTSIKGAQISAISAQTFTGNPIEPMISVTLNGKALEDGTDYELSYDNNVNVGTARVLVTGIGTYEGTVDTTFVIAAVNLSQVEIVMPNQYATGEPLTPTPVSVTAPSGYQLVEGTDYDITGYLNNTKVGKAAVTLQGKGNFTGAVTAAFEIVEKGSTDDAGKTNTLPKTGDSTSIAPIVVAGVAGVALVGAAGVLIARRSRKE